MKPGGGFQYIPFCQIKSWVVKTISFCRQKHMNRMKNEQSKSEIENTENAIQNIV